MKNPTITFVINGETYSLCADDTAIIDKISSAERRQLTTLLEAIKRQEEKSQATVQRAAERSNAALPGASANIAARQMPEDQANRPERLGSGDADQLMARLILEEKRNRKPGLTKTSLYKFVGGFAVFVILLVLIF